MLGPTKFSLHFGLTKSKILSDRCLTKLLSILTTLFYKHIAREAQ